LHLPDVMRFVASQYKSKGVRFQRMSEYKSIWKDSLTIQIQIFHESFLKCEEFSDHQTIGESGRIECLVSFSERPDDGGLRLHTSISRPGVTKVQAQKWVEQLKAELSNRLRTKSGRTYRPSEFRCPLEALGIPLAEFMLLTGFLSSSVTAISFPRLQQRIPGKINGASA
jgi:hypothetical protein